ncbi:hypothetical protein CBG46_01280 [Actinobacillus succinogenes]|uniref:Putative ABC-type Co2+ transport system, periplasmic component n=1 Tax=Actinobacillus succinogenes (strain ATCC 55618 / DSM 22257 / CCUG 43843 / 130Z) TaxID=339671 RepID=A6VMH0_ACTSZ|nr:DUF4198 domain-containing protein [Actinobacillus succinogenes]ABR74167.1 putative ABC-type Co2+ transport system, periplasmic component [Actinobacillus succinogenes 130Z]PHI39402.1 hypothetical protein CBG46_01280 [Actinobacillus succinogenes]
MKKTVFILTALFAFPALAHNVWLEKVPQQNSDYVLKFGHETTETYPESKVKSVQAINADGKQGKVDLSFHPGQDGKGETHIKADNAAIVYVQFDNGIWSKLPNGKFVEKSKKDVPDAEFSLNPMKFGKAVLSWNEQATKPHNMRYELVPQAKPVAGKPLAILVLHNGNPVAGIPVGAGEDQQNNLSDENGIALFTPSPGTNKVRAEFNEKATDNPDYSDRSIEYMLTFDTDDNK